MTGVSVLAEAMKSLKKAYLNTCSRGVPSIKTGQVPSMSFWLSFENMQDVPGDKLATVR